jgi:hypothetical protein
MNGKSSLKSKVSKLKDLVGEGMGGLYSGLLVV